MARPSVHPTTERVYGTLPEFYRTADEAQEAGPNGWPLLRYLSLVTDQLGDVEDLIDRIDRRPGSDLVDPNTADAAWLPWLAQLVGVNIDNRTVDEARYLIANAEVGWAFGSTAGIRAAVAATLTGGRTVIITRHYLGDPLVVRIRTFQSDTPDPAATARAALDLKPAGIRFVLDVLAGPTWTETPATWNQWSGSAETWSSLADRIPGTFIYAAEEVDTTDPYGGY